MPLLSRLLLALAAVCTVVALLGAWVDRQLLNTDDWTRTSAALLRDPVVRDPLADAIAAEIADGSRASAALQATLPPALQPLAGGAGGVVREAAQRTVRRVLASGAVQQAWVNANRVASEQLVAIVEGKNVKQTSRGVVLDLRPLATQVAQELGFSGKVIQRLPADKTEIVIMRNDQLSTLQTVGDVLGALSWIPGVAALLLFALAVWRGGAARRRVVLASGGVLAGSALLVLVVRRVAGRHIVDAITKGGPMEPTGSAVWQIVTTLLAELAVVVLIVGSVTMFGAWLAGPGRRASWLRARLAPWLDERPAVAFGAVALAYLALVAWGPLTVLRRVWPIVIFAVLLAAGLWVLREQVIRERRQV